MGGFGSAAVTRLVPVHGRNRRYLSMRRMAKNTSSSVPMRQQWRSLETVPALYHTASLPCSQGAAESVGTSVASFPSHPLKWESCQSHLHVSSQDPSRMGCALRICQLPPRHKTPWNFPMEIPFCLDGRVGPSPLHDTRFCPDGWVGPSPRYCIAGRCAGWPTFICDRQYLDEWFPHRAWLTCFAGSFGKANSLRFLSSALRVRTSMAAAQ